MKRSQTELQFGDSIHRVRKHLQFLFLLLLLVLWIIFSQKKEKRKKKTR